jgi:hypothetical protein
MDGQELKDIADDFATVGECRAARIIKHRVGEIEFTAAEDMAAAIKKLDNRRVSGEVGVRMKAYEKRL